MDGFDKVFPFQRVIVGLVLALGLWVGPERGNAQIPPGEDWRTLDTEHFRITYPSQLLDLARRAADRAETAWTELAETFVDPPRQKVDLVITDHADVSNGFSRVFPSNRIVVYAPPPVDGFGLPHMDEWMELVVTHELAHIFHEDYARGLGGTLRKVFGRVPLEWPFFPGAATPGWVVEGIATYYESEFTKAGRVRGSFHEMVVRTAVLEGSFESIDQTSGDSPVWPGGERYYVYGSLFLKHLMDQHGGEAMGAFVREVGSQWLPYRINSAAKETLGVSFSDAWVEWEGGLRARYAALRDSLQERVPITEAEALTEGGYYAWNPEPSPDGRGVAFSRSDGRSDPQIRFKDLQTGGEEELARTNNLSQFSWIPSGGILFSQIGYTDSYRIRGDLHVLEPGGAISRVTEGERLDHPDAAPDGARAVAVQEGEGSNRLVMVDLTTGSVEPLTEFAAEELWSYPRWSPDGRWIAAGRWSAGAYFDVVILDPSGETIWEVTKDRAIDNAPSWSPDGRWLLWSSDRTGIPNLFAAPVDADSGEPGPTRQITNLLGGGAYPAVDPAGRWIYFSSYHADGWRVERIPFEPGSWFVPFPLAPTFRAEADLARFDRRASGEGRPYNSLQTLRPTYWAPTYREGDHTETVQVLRPGYGIYTSGEDLVGRHSYSLSGTLSRGVGSFNGQASYSYGGLENPVLSVALSQTHDAGSRPLAGVTEAQDTVPLYLVERDRAVGLGAVFLRRRFRTQTTLGFAVSHVWEDNFLLERNLEESTRFRLRRPEVRLGEARATLSFGNARSFPFSVSAEDGVGATIRARVRKDLTLVDSLKGAEGWDRSYQDLVGYFAAYKGFRGPGFGNHVLGFRGSGGVAGGPGADAFHFEVGGASGGDVPLEFIQIGQGLLFPVRGYITATRFGRYAWSTSVEYRFPIKLINRGPGLFPLHFDWISGALFFDAGNAWGPEITGHGGENPRRASLASTGAELLVRALPLWFQNIDLRFGLALPLVEEQGLRSYLRLGMSF